MQLGWSLVVAIPLFLLVIFLREGVLGGTFILITTMPILVRPPLLPILNVVLSGIVQNKNQRAVKYVSEKSKAIVYWRVLNIMVLVVIALTVMVL